MKVEDGRLLDVDGVGSGDIFICLRVYAEPIINGEQNERRRRECTILYFSTSYVPLYGVKVKKKT